MMVVVPLPPDTDLTAEARELFDRRARGDAAIEARIAALKLVTPHYRHVEGTGLAEPIVAGVVACMLEANPALDPLLVREVLIAAAHPVPGVSPEQQGAGVLDAAGAVACALRTQGAASQMPWSRHSRHRLQDPANPPGTLSGLEDLPSMLDVARFDEAVRGGVGA